MGKGSFIPILLLMSQLLTKYISKVSFGDEKRSHFSLREAVMQRDKRLTGYLRGQSDRAAAPDGFELNDAWKVCYSVMPKRYTHTNLVGESSSLKNLLDTPLHFKSIDHYAQA